MHIAREVNFSAGLDCRRNPSSWGHDAGVCSPTDIGRRCLCGTATVGLGFSAAEIGRMCHRVSADSSADTVVTAIKTLRRKRRHWHQFDLGGLGNSYAPESARVESRSREAIQESGDKIVGRGSAGPAPQTSQINGTI